jgi:uncharacterized phage-associated protein
MKATVFDSEKALAALMYVAAALPERRNLYKVLKVIYRANKTHLERYGRELFHQRYQALEWGAVPQLAYDIVTHVRDKKSQHQMPEGVQERISVSKDDTIKPLVEVPMELLSKAAVECLSEAIEFFRPMTFKQVADNAHEDEAYKATKRDKDIPLERIIMTLPDGKLLLEHIKAA